MLDSFISTFECESLEKTKQREDKKPLHYLMEGLSNKSDEQCQSDSLRSSISPAALGVLAYLGLQKYPNGRELLIQVILVQ